VALVAIIEVHEEGVVGGALRARPVPAILREQGGDVQPAVVELCGGGQVEVVVPIRLVLGAGAGRRVTTLGQQGLGVGQAIALAGGAGLFAAPAPFMRTGILGGNDQVVGRDAVAGRHEAAVVATLAWPVIADCRGACCSCWSWCSE